MMYNWIRKKINQNMGELSKNVARVFSVKILIYIITFLSSVYIARALGPSEKGCYAIFQTIVAFIVQFEFLGISNAVTYYASKNKDCSGKCFGVILFVFLVSLFLNSIIFLILYINKVDYGFNGVLFFLVFLTGSLSLLYMLISNLFVGLNNISKFNFLELSSCIMLLLFSASCYMLTGKLTSRSMVIITLSNLLLVNFLSIIFLRGIKPLFEKVFFVELIKYAFRSYLSCLAVALVLKIDIFMLKRYVSDEQLGLYSLAVNLAELFYMVSSSIVLVVFPKFSSIADFGEKAVYMKRLLKGMFFISVPVLLAFAFIAPIFIKFFYGVDYAYSSYSLRILLPGIFFWTYYNYFSVFFASENKFIHTIWIPIVATALNVFLNYFLIPRFGINGAAVASTITYFSSCLLIAFCYINHYNAKMRVKTI